MFSSKTPAVILQFSSIRIPDVLKLVLEGKVGSYFEAVAIGIALLLSI